MTILLLYLNLSHFVKRLLQSRLRPFLGDMSGEVAPASDPAHRYPAGGEQAEEEEEAGLWVGQAPLSLHPRRNSLLICLITFAVRSDFAFCLFNAVGSGGAACAGNPFAPRQRGPVGAF